MPTVSIPPVEEARSVFRRLGYAVSGDGPALRAERKWRTVEVHVVSGEATADARQPALGDGGPDASDLRCFVTWREEASALSERLASRDPGCQWAVVGVDRDGSYEVLRSPGAGPDPDHGPGTPAR
jgi:hypothetical protein